MTRSRQNHQTPRHSWSGRPDLNRRPLPPQGSALPPALRPDGNNYSGNSEARLTSSPIVEETRSSGRAVAQSFQFVKRGRGRAQSDWSAAGDSSPKGDLDVHVGTSEEPAEVTRFLPYPGRDASRYGGKLRNTDSEAFSLPSVGPHTHGAPIYENYGGDPPLRSVDPLPVLYGDEVLPLLVADEERIKVRQKADRWLFEPGPLELTEVVPKDRRAPTVDTHRSDVRFLARPDLASIREWHASPHRKVS